MMVKRGTVMRRRVVVAVMVAVLAMGIFMPEASAYGKPGEGYKGTSGSSSYVSRHKSRIPHRRIWVRHAYR